MKCPTSRLTIHRSFTVELLTMPFIIILVLFSLPISLANPSPMTNAVTDRLALLSFKSAISGDPSQALASWSNNSPRFCQWSGVTCSKATQRVIALDIRNLRLEGLISPSLANLTFLGRLRLDNNNLSGSIPRELGSLSHLYYLNLDINSLEGEIPIELGSNVRLAKLSLKGNRLSGGIPDFFGNLSSLAVLVLAFNNLNGVFPPSLWNLSSLTHLSLEYNKFSGALPEDIGRSLPRLQNLYLHHNELSGAIPPSIGDLWNLNYLLLGDNQLEVQKLEDWEFITSLANCSNLRQLRLSRNKIRGILPASIANLSVKLEYFSMSGNMVSGSIPGAICNLVGLKWLYLDNNKLTGDIPPTIASLGRLQLLSLESNGLSGSIPHTLRNLSQLMSLYLGFNQIGGLIPPFLGNLSQLADLGLQMNVLRGGIPSSIGTLTGLRYLDFAYNSISGTIPPSIWNSSNLLIFSAAANELTSVLPPELGEGLPRLQHISLYENQFHGPLPMSLTNASSLQVIQLYSNMFTGKIPHVFSELKGLFKVLLGDNQLEATQHDDWIFFDSLANCTKLRTLNLGFNKLSGKFPSSIANMSTSLEELVLEHNHLSGSILSEIGKLTNLTMLRLGYNLLSGNIPTNIGVFQRLRTLALGWNRFSGEIPSTIGNLTDLNRLNLGYNELTQVIPATLGNCSLQFLNLSYNKLSGIIPVEILSMSSLSMYLDLSHNLLTGPLPPEVGKLRNLGAFSVSGNKLSGRIPSALGNCEVMEYLSLNGNRFHGEVPATLKQLRGLLLLDLSSNNLSGNIPLFLETLPFLIYLNLTSNNLDGKVPVEGIFRNWSPSFLRENKELCGGNPNLHLPSCSEKTSTRGYYYRAWLVASASIGSIWLVFTLGVFIWNWKSRTRSKLSIDVKDYHMEMYSHWGNELEISYQMLHDATNGFSSANLIGMGGSGSVYRGAVHYGNTSYIAVKVLSLQVQGASRSFTAECDALKNMLHRNIVKLLAACTCSDFRGNEFKALVFEYMPNGSLDMWLHPEENDQEDETCDLSLIQRLNIAIEVSSALDYLHHYGPKPVVHSDIKPSNVLLDYDMSARLSDFGLARFVDRDPTQSVGNSIRLKGSIGYIAPEYVMTNNASTQGDVYSYGILLLEMFTGKRPTDEIFKDGLSLCEYVRAYFPDQVMDIVDPCFLLEVGDADIEGKLHGEDKWMRLFECLASVFEIALLCIKELPSERIQIGDATKKLMKTKFRYSNLNANNELQNAANK